MISFVIPLYNKEETVCGAVESVISQPKSLVTEIIVIDDGSTDRSLEVVAALTTVDPRLKIISQLNQGVSAARNKGVQVASEELVAFLDADDQIHPRYAETMVDLVSEIESAVLYTCNHHCLRYGRISVSPRSFPELHRRSFSLKQYRLSRCELINSSKVIVRRDEFLQAGGFPRGVALGEDQYTWVKLLRLGQGAYIEERLVDIFLSEDSSRHAREDAIPYLVEKYSENLSNLDTEEHRTIRYVYAVHMLGCLAAGNRKAFKLQHKAGRKLFPFVYILFCVASFFPISVFQFLRSFRERIR